MKITEADIKEIIRLYTSNEVSSVHKIAELYRTSHKTIRMILISNGIEINKRGGQLKYGRDVVLQRYRNKKILQEGYEKIAICKLTRKIYKDYTNNSGSLTEHIRKNYKDVIIPSSYKRRMIFESTGRYWHEEFFDIIERCIKETKKCKYCDWETIDIDNRTGAYVNHLLKEHNKSIDDYIKEFPEEIVYHKSYQIKKKRELSMVTEDDYLYCKICGEKMKTINNIHLKTHNITPSEYKLKYNVGSLMSNNLTTITSKRLSQYNEDMVPSFVSKDEMEIREFVISLGFNVIANDRKLLKGKEIDVLVPEIKLGIEYNGNKFHTEDYGCKYPNYHLDKLLTMNNKGYGLIQIFEDEWILNKELVKNKIKHILGKSSGVKIGARKCVIKEIYTKEKNDFLNLYHIQGGDTASIKYGAFYNDILVGVMTFKPITTVEFELTRFTTNYNYIISGLASKVIKEFIKQHKPRKIISFADRRWTININNNLYTNLGFELTNITKPDYRYYNTKIDRYKRFHKYNFRKQNLHKKYGLSMNLTEREMTKQLGYDRIWDCGLLKYELNF